MKRKGQVTSQMFMYIMAAIITGAILLFGISSIVKLKQSGEDAADTMFKNKIVSHFDEIISLSYESERVKEFTVISDFDTLCFISKDVIESPPPGFDSGHEKINTAISSEVESNIYLLGDKGMYALEVSPLYQSGDLSSGSYCHDIVGGKVKIWTKTLGDSIEITRVQ